MYEFLTDRCVCLLQMPIVLQKDPEQDEHGNIITDLEGKPLFRCGFKIGGGIDQDPTKSPQGYPDKVNKNISDGM